MNESVEKRALIIGAAGFVGAYLAAELYAAGGWHVVVTKMPFEQINISDVQIYDLDILDRAAVDALLSFERPDVIFHLAAQSSVAVSWKNPGLTVDVNIKGTLNVLDAVRDCGYSPRLLLIGSSEEYGPVRPDEIPVKETNPLRPSNIYAVTKNTQNQIGRLYKQAYGIDVLSTRSFNHIGPNQSPIFVVADFCKQVSQIEKGQLEPVLKVGNLSARRDFTDVRDVVRAYRLLADLGLSGETYNVGQGHAVSIEEILQHILKLTPKAIRVETDPDKLRPVDVPVVEADIKKLVMATGWKPRIALEKTLIETLNYWREQF